MFLYGTITMAHDLLPKLLSVCVIPLSPPLSGDRTLLERMGLWETPQVRALAVQEQVPIVILGMWPERYNQNYLVLPRPQRRLVSHWCHEDSQFCVHA